MGAPLGDDIVQRMITTRTDDDFTTTTLYELVYPRSFLNALLNKGCTLDLLCCVRLLFYYRMRI